MQLLDFINRSRSMYHAVLEQKKRLKDAGWQELKNEDSWKLKSGGKYFVITEDSALVAFEIPKKKWKGFHIVGAHNDSPAFRVKPNPMMSGAPYIALNMEVYGGAILRTWLDRPLSLAGRVYLKTEDPMKPDRLFVDIDRNLMIIPSVAIHMDREVNSKGELNPQKHMIPILGNKLGEISLEELLAKYIGVDKRDILDYDLFTYLREPACKLGIHEEFYSAPKLDNLGMVHAGLEALLASGDSDKVKVFVSYDHEEVGSGSVQGADSELLNYVLKRIVLQFGKEEDFYSHIAESFLISCDQAHAAHPAHMDKADPTNRPVINKGPVIKIAANKAYTSDGHSVAIFKGLCQKAGVPYQMFTNRSDLRGGSTIGPIAERRTQIKSVDVGNALFAMHSANELGGVKDQEDMITVLKLFYSLS